VIALLVALAPALRIPMISPASMIRARDAWLRGVLACGIVALLPTAPWLSVMGGWFLWRWRGVDLLPSLVTWAAIGATWFLLRAMPAGVWAYLPWAWLALAGVQTAVMAWSVYRHGPHRATGTLGSPACTALFLALVSPFAPWWAWPVLALGLYLSWSWLALIGVAVGLVWSAPWTALLSLPVFVMAGLVWAASNRNKTGRARWLMERTPRGASLSPVRGRLLVWLLATRELTWGGHGPGSMAVAVKRWAARYGLRGMPQGGEGHMELLQMAYEYGALGIVAIALFVGQVALSLRLGDPWSAACVIGLVLSLGHWPMRLPPVAVVWFAISAGVMR
jgi:hypothetical protein